MGDFRVVKRDNGDFEVRAEPSLLPFDAIDPMLEAWGRYYGAEPISVGELSENVRAPDVHALARAQRMAPGSRQEVIARHLDRGGQSRRRLMGAAAGLRGVLPAHFVDPVPCIESDRVARHPDQDPKHTPIVRAVQEAWLALRRVDELQGTVVLYQYQLRGFTQETKAERVSEELGRPVSLKRYRDELRAAKQWLHGRLSA